jgi:hypothetical protein
MLLSSKSHKFVFPLILPLLDSDPHLDPDPGANRIRIRTKVDDKHSNNLLKLPVYVMPTDNRVNVWHQNLEDALPDLETLQYSILHYFLIETLGLYIRICMKIRVNNF